MDFFQYCETGNIEGVKRLLNEGEDVNQVDNHDSNGLYIACQHKKYEMVIFLLDQGIDINKKTKGWFNPVAIAIYNFEDDPIIMGDIIKELLFRGAVIPRHYEEHLRSYPDIAKNIIDIIDKFGVVNIKPAIRN